MFRRVLFFDGESYFYLYTIVDSCFEDSYRKLLVDVYGYDMVLSIRHNNLSGIYVFMFLDSQRLIGFRQSLSMLTKADLEV